MQAAGKGVIANYTIGDITADDPAGGADWGVERTIRADLVRDLCLGETAQAVHAKGVRVKGARIVGPLDFEFVTFQHAVALVACFIEEDLNLSQAQARSLTLAGSRFPSITAEHLKTTGSVDLRDTFACGGEVLLVGASIDGDLTCVGATFENPGGKALSLDRARINGNVFLRDGFTAKGEVRLVAANIEGDLDCASGIFENRGSRALGAERAKVKGNVYLFDGFVAKGDVVLSGTAIDGDLVCSNGIFENPGGSALDISDAKIGHGVFLRNGFAAKGMVELVRADIGGALDCNGGTFENPGDYAIFADYVRVKGPVFLRDGFRAIGEVRLVAANIEGGLDCAGGMFENPSGIALLADRAKITAGVYLANGFAAKGEIRLLGADIDGNLDCNGGTFDNPDDEALSADSARINGNVFLRDGFAAKGEVRLRGVKIRMDLDCVGATLENPGGRALNAGGARVEGSLFLRDLAAPPKGQVDLSYAHVGVVVDRLADWPSPGELVLDGFVYDAFGGGAPTNLEARLEWLSRQPKGKYWPQPYEQLAKVLREMGHERASREIAIAQQRALRKSGQLGIWSRAWNRILDVVIGHGYKPWRAIWLILGLPFIGAIVYGLAFEFGLMRSLQTGVLVSSQDYIHFQPLIYSLDVLIPGMDFDQARSWSPNNDNSLSLFVWMFIVLQDFIAWTTAIIIAAALPNLVTRG